MSLFKILQIEQVIRDVRTYEWEIISPYYYNEREFSGIVNDDEDTDISIGI